MCLPLLYIIQCKNMGKCILSIGGRINQRYERNAIVSASLVLIPGFLHIHTSKDDQVPYRKQYSVYRLYQPRLCSTSFLDDSQELMQCMC